MSTVPIQTTTGEDKTAAIVSYITIFGFIAAIFMHNGKKTSLGAFHLRQMLGIILSAIAIAVASMIPVLGLLIALAGNLTLFVLWVMGLLAAVNGQEKPVPVLGPMYQKWFAGAFS